MREWRPSALLKWPALADPKAPIPKAVGAFALLQLLAYSPGFTHWCCWILGTGQGRNPVLQPLPRIAGQIKERDSRITYILTAASFFPA
jgi:hypothetical protein